MRMNYILLYFENTRTFPVKINASSIRGAVRKFPELFEFVPPRQSVPCLYAQCLQRLRDAFRRNRR